MTGKGPSEPAGSPAVVKNNVVDAAVAVIVFLLGAVVVFEARRLGAGWTSDGPGSGYFPFYIGLILCISGLGILAEALLGKGRDRATFVNRQQLRRVLSVLIPAAVYVLGIMFVGIYLASSIYIAAFMIVLGEYPKIRSVLLALCISAVFFLMFEVWFKVPLYKGRFDPLHFLGY